MAERSACLSSLREVMAPIASLRAQRQSTPLNSAESFAGASRISSSVTVQAVSALARGLASKETLLPSQKRSFSRYGGHELRLLNASWLRTYERGDRGPYSFDGLRPGRDLFVTLRLAGHRVAPR